ncbi:hypothetical protein HDE69_003932 [Pedobacter cryoconitis]|uniref:Uncharacterized protein n=1 Tax=Pedobacter cryoconitis TaxID=188932 RepID=A0A7W8YW33_9SPHI|nr:hypothetical protein [Pedobacter cryoconitis]MBB5622850.1 hypothetical protein [Pedobacter cryoconitis]MBB5645096.1 hypothetical protein [Pedobacter cryoconitis]
MKYSIDIKSVMIGLFIATVLFGAFSFKQEGSEPVGRYQTSVGEKGVVILDTKTGAYITNPYVTNNGWSKGNFSHTSEIVKDTKDKNL